MDERDVGKLVQQAQVKPLALKNLSPSLDKSSQANLYFKQPIQKFYFGRTFVGEDGMPVMIPLS
ncbi:MAG: hypothetical protein WCA79_13370 [Anaerolineales bacterium]